MKLLDKQEHAVYYLKDNTTVEVLYGGAAGGGKSALGCLWLVEMCQNYPGTRWMMGRSKLDTLKATTLKTFFDLCSDLGINDQYEYYENKKLIKWSNGSEIILKDLFYYPSDQNFDSLGSLEITGAFIDECVQIIAKAWKIVKSRIRYKLSENNLTPKILGTCNPSQNWVYSTFYKPNKDGTLPPRKRFIQSLPTDNPHLPASYLEELLDLDENDKQRLYYGNWDYNSDPTKLCDYDAICDMFTNDHVNGTKKRISSDLAMQGRDRFLAISWRGLRGRVSINKEKATGRSIELALKELKTVEGVGNTQIVADSDGLGAYLESYIKNIKTFHGNGRAVNHELFGNIKDECGFKLAEVINNRLIKIDCTEEEEELIKKEISICLKRDNLDADKKRLIKKPKMKELLGYSPDFLDVLLMGMIFEIEIKPPRRGMVGVRR